MCTRVVPQQDHNHEGGYLNPGKKMNLGINCFANPIFQMIESFVVTLKRKESFVVLGDVFYVAVVPPQ